MREWMDWLWEIPQRLLRQILALEDTDHSKALGVAIGMFIGMTPTVGIQMAMVLLFAFFTSRLFYFNRMAALLTVYISNPFTVLPLYWMNYKIGTWFVEGDVTRAELAKALEYHGFAEWWEAILELFLAIGGPLIVGSLVVATVLGLASYPLMRWLLKWLPPPADANPAESTMEAAKSPSPLIPVTPSIKPKP
jgi:uncharacterized protein (DUF2062 family)